MNVRLSQTAQKGTSRGFALIVAVLVSSIVLAVGLSIANVTLKQYVFSGIGRDSEIAFYAADAAMECALFHDTASGSVTGDGAHVFDIDMDLDKVNSQNEFTCMNQRPELTDGVGGDGIVNWGESIMTEIEWGNDPTVCAKLSVTKVTDGQLQGLGQCPEDVTCTRIESRGYNRSCAEVNAGTDKRIVERALRANY